MLFFALYKQFISYLLLTKTEKYASIYGWLKC